MGSVESIRWVAAGLSRNIRADLSLDNGSGDIVIKCRQADMTNPAAMCSGAGKPWDRFRRAGRYSIRSVSAGRVSAARTAWPLTVANAISRVTSAAAR